MNRLGVLPIILEAKVVFSRYKYLKVEEILMEVIQIKNEKF